MRKRLLIAAVFASLVGFGYVQSRELPLVHFLISTLWVFPLFYFSREKAFVLLAAGWAAVVFFQIEFFLRNGSPRVPVLWGVQALLFAALCYDHAELRRFLARAQEKKEDVRRALEMLQAKYQTRLNSLRHLEVQVSSLMNLFEIARDFSECMDFGTLSEFLLKKLRTELSFQRMQIYLFPKPGHPKDPDLIKVYEMSPEGVREEERELSLEELEIFVAIKKAKVMVRHENSWYFPILEGEELSAVFAVHGIKEEDLARVEVLSAYLVLLIKKIKLYETVRELAIIDELTQVFVRNHFMERLDEELKRSIRFKLPLAVLMLDIDLFKRYNDEFGHLVGDATLKEVAEILKRNLRRVDLVGRYGGEEFVVAMPETRVMNAAEVAERIRSNIARNDFQVYNDKTKVTVSQGIAVFDGESFDGPETTDTRPIVMELIRMADEAMYKAKEEGRNRVCLYKDIKRS